MRARADTASPALPEGSVVARNAFGVYCVPLSLRHRPAAATTLRGEIWEEATLRFIAGVAAGKEVVHAGAFFGDFLPALARACSHVWAFEPVALHYTYAALTIELNELHNVTLQQVALSDRTGPAAMRTADESGRLLGGLSAVVDEGGAPGTTEEVALGKLDELVPSDVRVGLIHLDLEGHEPRALRGARRIVLRDRPTIVSESRLDESTRRDLFAPVPYFEWAKINANYIYGVTPVSVGMRARIIYLRSRDRIGRVIRSRTRRKPPARTEA